MLWAVILSALARIASCEAVRCGLSVSLSVCGCGSYDVACRETLSAVMVSCWATIFALWDRYKTIVPHRAFPIWEYISNIYIDMHGIDRPPIPY